MQMVGEVNRAVGGIGTLGFVQEGKCVSSRHYDILSSRNGSSQIATGLVLFHRMEHNKW